MWIESKESWSNERRSFLRANSANAPTPAALRHVKRRKAPIIVAKLDRLSRGCGLHRRADVQKVPIVVELSHVDPFMLHLYAALAEKERLLAQARAGIAIGSGRGGSYRWARTRGRRAPPLSPCSASNSRPTGTLVRRSLPSVVPGKGTGILRTPGGNSEPQDVVAWPSRVRVEMAFHTTSVALASSRRVHARGVARRSRLPESGPHANGAASRGCATSRPCPQLAADAFANRAVSSIPPILHRKELLLALDDPDRAAFAALTRDAEEAGLFRGSTTIGTLDGEALLKQGGLVQAHRLVPRRSLLETSM